MIFLDWPTVPKRRRDRSRIFVRLFLRRLPQHLQEICGLEFHVALYYTTHDKRDSSHPFQKQRLAMSAAMLRLAR
jgi:hypothetical protein